MYKLICMDNKLYSELCDVANLFLPQMSSGEFFVEHTISLGEKTVNKIKINDKEFVYCDPPIISQDKLLMRRQYTRSAKLSLYKALSTHFKRCLAWGALTGVRPTKLAYEAQESGISHENVADYLQKTFLISSEKSSLLADITANQRGLNRRNLDKVNLYIHIPFCPSRCYYCSFISVTKKALSKYVKDYVASLAREIQFSKQLISQFDKTIFSVYIGGGTPSSLDCEELEHILQAIGKVDVEFTLEAGRPDTINKDKLHLMRQYGVNRISVNPQSLNDKTLQLIGRSHTVQEFFDSFNLAKEYGFIINTDLIAGLKGESTPDFMHSLQGLIDCRPHNITVHTLSIKNGSEYKNSQPNQCLQAEHECMEAREMMEYAHKSLYKSGYVPYYLYRQKRMSDNLENVGYSLKGYECVNNITTMEESMSVLANGAGGISKILVGDNRIERYANLKEVKLYLEQFEQRLNKKNIFISNQFTTNL